MKEFKEIEAAAFKNEQIPGCLTQAEQFAYFCTRSLYNDYRKRNLDKSQAKIEREQIKKTYQAAVDQYKQEIALYRRIDDVRVSLSKISKEMKLHGCPLCQRLLDILDGRLNE